MDPRDHHELEALERMLVVGLDRTEPADLTDRLEKLLAADIDEMPAPNERSRVRQRYRGYRSAIGSVT